ncbi:MAG: alpha-galactosidase [Bacteroidales bacterium]|nr:alpha-galactosidase [Bacteroidales bacterium]MBQ6299647.1 alpha-galactosidase [Bacteroidales bacterium]
MRTRISLTFLTLSLALIAAGCSHDFSCGDISLSVDKAGQLHIASAAASTPLIRDAATLSTLTADGAEVAFGPAEKSSRVLTDTFGKGSSLVLESNSERGLVREISVTAYDRYPSTFVVRASYTNESDSDIAVNGWSVCDLKVNAAGDDPCFWSFQGQSTEERDDWLLPVGDGFYQKNYMGMNNSDYGGGVPVVCLWRRDAGVMIGHLEPNPVLVSLPVCKKAGDDFASVGIVKEYETPVVLHPGETLETYESFISVFTGDCFGALRNYAGLLEARGVVMPESEPAAFEPAWCAWGYERRFTIDEILGTLPKVKELGFKWATLDDGYQIAEGDWDLTPARFPHGDADMKMLVDQFHAYGLKAELWWAPLAADPGTAFLKQYPQSVILDKEGNPQEITWWNSWYLSPVDPDVIREQQALVVKFLKDWGFDGLKLDGQHMNAVAPDYNPAHHPDDPEKDVRELPDFFKMIYETARSVKPHAVLQFCPCGDCFSVYHLPYVNKTVSSDPESSWQIRTKGYVLRALAPRTAYYGDHIELSDGGNDYQTQLGIGAVLGTKFTWPKDNPYVRHSYLLTPEKEALLKNALEIYETKRLSEGEIVSGLYDIGYDFPETYVIRKDGVLNYAFYTRGPKVEKVELRGLEKGCDYQIRDYYNDVDYGVVRASEKTVLDASFDHALLLEAIKL